MGYSLPNQRAATRSLRDHRKSIAFFWLQWILIKLSIYLSIYLSPIVNTFIESYLKILYETITTNICKQLTYLIFAPSFDAIDFHEMRKFLASKLRTVFNYIMHWQSIFGE